MKVVRIASDDSVNSARFVPLNKIEMIYIKADGTDSIMVNEQWYACHNGIFVVLELSDYVGEKK